MWTPVLEVGEPVLVAPAVDEPAWRLVVDLVQDGQVTLVTTEDEEIPRAWRELDEVHVTRIGRFSVYLIHVPVVRCGDTRLVLGAPADDAVQRRAYARVSSPVPAECAALDPETGTWAPFTAEVRDLGGGGCAMLTDATPETGAHVGIALDLDDDAPLVAMGRVLPRDDLPTIGKPLTRVEFVLIREPDRDRVMRFVLLSLARARRAQRGRAVS